MKIEISNIIFVILIASTTIYLTFLTTKGGLTDNRYNNFWKKLTDRGRRVFYLLIFILIILVFQELNNKNSNFNKEKILQNEQLKRDSLITVGIKTGVDSSNQQLFSNLAKAFADQNLKIDTLDDKISILESSSVTNIYSQEDPILIIYENGIRLKSNSNNTLNFDIAITSQDAGSSNHKMNIQFLYFYTDSTYSLSDRKIIPKDLKIPKNKPWNTDLVINSIKEIESLYVYIYGTYSTVDRTKSYNIDNIYYYKLSEKKAIQLGYYSKNEIKKYFTVKPNNNYP